MGDKALEIATRLVCLTTLRFLPVNASVGTGDPDTRWAAGG